VPAPFADRATLGFFSAFVQTWKLVAVDSQRFFASVRIDQTGSALFFALLAGSIGLAFTTGYEWLSGPMILKSVMQAPGGTTEGTQLLTFLLGGAFTLGRIVASPLIVLASIYAGAGILHLLLLMFSGAGRGFNATLTVVAYSFGPWLLGVIPGCGSAAGMIWQLVVLILGLAAVHRAETWKATVAVLAAATLGCCCSCFCGTSMTGVIMQMVKQATGAAGGGVSDL
jgi:hypothetical protein